MSDFGLKSSNDRKDVIEADNNDLAFTSKFPLLKTFMKGSVDITGTGSKIINHNLGYLPAFIVTVSGVSGIGAGTRMIMDYDTIQTSERVLAYADKNTITFTVNGGGANIYNIFYYIFVDKVR